MTSAAGMPVCGSGRNSINRSFSFCRIKILSAARNWFRGRIGRCILQGNDDKAPFDNRKTSTMGDEIGAGLGF